MKFNLSTIPTNEKFRIIELDTGNVCHLQCPTCNRQDPTFEPVLKRAKFLTVDDFKVIIEKFPNVERFFLGLIFDEPTFNPNIIDIICYLKSKNKSITFNTNGGNNFELLNWLSLINLMDNNDRVVWSLDGLSQETYQQHRKNGNFKKLIDTITKVITNSKKYPGPTHIIQIVKFKHNEKEIEKEFEKFKRRYEIQWNKPLWDIIDSNGRCTIPTDEVEPTWDVNGFYKLKNEVNEKLIPDNPACLNDITIFMGHNGQLGLCLANALESIKFNEPFTIYHSVEEINKYIHNFYMNFYNNDTCKFFCSSHLQKKKLKLNLDIDIT